MATDVDISNMALSHLGAEPIVVSLNPPDGSVEADMCSRFYPVSRRTLLASFAWGFATRRETLAQLGDDPDEYFRFSYALPNKSLRIVRVLQGARHLENGADYAVHHGVLHTHAPAVDVLYTYDEDNTTYFSPEFESALSFLLASYLAGPIIRGSEGAQTGGSFRERAFTEAARASAIDANEKGSTTTLLDDYEPEAIQARR